MSTQIFLRHASLALVLLPFLLVPSSVRGQQAAVAADDNSNDKSSIAKRPNILFAIADDWGWPHAGAYSDPVVKTPTFDRIAKEGLLCHQAFVSSPSCTPSRGAILAGMYHWQLGPSANLYGPFPDSIESYPERLAQVGYRIGKTRKCWGPGKPETPGRQLGGPNFPSFEAFLAEQDDQPFCFWLGSFDPHRDYELGSGKKSGMNLDEIDLLPCFPDNPTVRGDVADYYFEVQRFDRFVGDAIKQLEQRGLLDNTIVVMTGDHGMPFPRCKGNLYDSGTRVPLAIRYPAKIQAGSATETLISLVDLAPTFLQLADAEVPETITGKSLLPVFEDSSFVLRPDGIVFGKERHCPAQEAPIDGGYPCRGLRTNDYLYVRNYFPDRWPSGNPNWKNSWMKGSWLGDTDNGPTKTEIAKDPTSRFFELCFAKRPAEELYDLRNDPDQLKNLAEDSEHSAALGSMRQSLQQQLLQTHDPRANDPECDIDAYQPYTGGSPKHPDFKKSRK